MNNSKMVAILPAAGHAARLGLMARSKEVLPLGNIPDIPITTLSLILEQLERAGVAQAVVVLREGKWDIPEHLLTLKSTIEVVCKIIKPTRSVPETVSAALPFVDGSAVLLAFPDVLYAPNDALLSLVERWNARPVDVLLGLFMHDRPDKADMVELDSKGKVIGLYIKESRRDLTYAWGAAIWSPRFSRWLLQQVNGTKQALIENDGKELWIGNMFSQALNHDMEVSAIVVSGGRFIDIGTQEDLERARQAVRS